MITFADLLCLALKCSSGSMLEFYSDAYDSTTSFKMEKPALMSVTTVAIDQVRHTALFRTPCRCSQRAL